MFAKWFSRHASFQVLTSGKLTVTGNRDGETVTYASLEELPPEIRERVWAHIPDLSLGSESQTFGSVEDLPPEWQEKLEQAMNGNDTHIEIVDGCSGQRHVYDSLDDVPPEIRARIEQMRQQADGEAVLDGSTPLSSAVRITFKRS